MGTTRWPAMRGHSMALSGLSVALLLATVLTTVHSQDMMSGTMQCQCSCASDCTSGDSVTCDCPEPAYACAPGFTQVCPLMLEPALLECHLSALEAGLLQQRQQQQR